MTGFATREFGVGLLLTAATVAVLMAVTWLIGRAVGRYNVIDVAWGVGFVAVAAVSFTSSSGEGDVTLRVVMLAVVSIWGLRLAAYLAWRSRGQGEDRRYALMFQRVDGVGVPRYAAIHVFVPQGVAMWFISLPVQVAMFQAAPSAIVPVVGVIVWAIGLGLGSVGDLQLSRFAADPANGGRVMDRGLWRFTRHPNYFGDACAWWGIFLVACGQWQGLLTIGSPMLMTWTLVAKTGRPMLEHEMESRRPGYTDYVRRTSGFVPLPPRS